MTSIDAIYKQMQEFGLSTPEIDSIEAPTEWKVLECINKYINDHDDIVEEHKPMFYQLFSRHERWTSEKALNCVDITIYDATPESEDYIGERIKSMGTISLNKETGQRQVHSIAHLKCIYSEQAMKCTMQAMKSAVFNVRDIIRNKNYRGICNGCGQKNPKHWLYVTYGNDSISSFSHAYFGVIKTQVLATHNDGKREHLTDPETMRQWLDFFVANIKNVDLLCKTCNESRHATRLDSRRKRFTHIKAL